MAILSFLFSFLARKMGDIVQAIFGWSITALFGKLPSKKALAVTISLVLSLAWPLFVIGLFVPGVAAWAVALLPLHQWLGATTLRIVWAVLAIVAPVIVGLLVHWAAPGTKGGMLRTAVAGYPLAIGFFLSFVVTAITVPIVKLFSIARGWSDTHVYVQPRPDRYDTVLRELAEACARAGIEVEVGTPPTRMMLATKILRFFARSAISPIVANELGMVRGHDVELTLYPADLLLRGAPESVAHVRAMLTRTHLDADAYLVESPRAQSLQDDFGRLVDVLKRHEERGDHARDGIVSLLVKLWKDAANAKISYEEWVMLDNIAHRVERKIAIHQGREPRPLDDVDDHLTELAKKDNAAVAERSAMPQRLITA